MARSRRSTGHGRRGRLRTQWATFIGSPASLGAGANVTATIASSAVLDSMTEPRVVRIRGVFQGDLEGTGAYEEQLTVLGIRLQTPAGIILPITHPDESWMYIQFMQFRQNVVTDPRPSFNITIDVKSQRVVKGRGNSLVMVIENSPGGSGVRFSTQLRALLAEGRS